MADRKQKKSEEKPSAQTKEQKIMQQHKQKMMPLVKFLKKEGLEFHIAQVGPNRIEYFRLDELQRLQQQKQQKIDKNALIKQLLSQMDLIYLRRPTDSKHLKYPHTLQPAKALDSGAKFATFRFDTTISRKWLIISVLVGILAMVLFPVWPFALKYAVWLVSLYLLVIIVGLLLFRLVVYVVCVVLGYNVWILPNLLGDYGFWESFKPFIHYQRWEKSKLNLLIRVTALLLLVGYGVKIYMDPEFLKDHVSFTNSTINEIHNWGVGKIKNEPKFSERAITNLDKILNETADVELLPDEGGEETSL